MTTSREWSDRWSDRVEPDPAIDEVSREFPARKAPESVPSRALPKQPRGQHARRRLSQRRLVRLEDDLSPRERAVLGSLAEFRLLTTGQLQRLHFADHATEGAASRICRRILARLAHLGVIDHLERRVGGIRAGSASYVWQVGPIGDRLLRQAEGTDGRARRKEPSMRFLDHCLAVSECYVELVEAARQGQIELLTHQAEPGCWRYYLGAHGAGETLKPDLYAVTVTPDFEDSWFIEVDRATESLPTVLKKCDQYVRYRKTGREQQERGVFPAVLWVVPDDRRAEAIARVIRRRFGTQQEHFRVVPVQCFTNAIVGESCPQPGVVGLIERR